MRAVCELCQLTLSRTCRPPPPWAKRGTKLFGQGRPVGKLWAFLEHGGGLPAAHTRDDHKVFVLVGPGDLEVRNGARARARAQ
eukprot:8098776-Pyramimonas_sp.AAC.1